MTRKTTFRLAIAALCVTVLGAACSDDTSTASTTTPVPAFPTDPAGSELETTLADIVDETGAPSLGAAAFNDAGNIDIAAAGVRSNGSPTQVTPEDPYHIGSNTKAMTAALVGLVGQDNDSMTFDTTLGDLFSDGAAIDAGYADVTLADLLAHVGGTPSETPDIDDEDFFALPLTEQRAIATDLILGQAPEYAPGTEHRYSNTGYVILGAALETLTGDSFEDLLQQRLFDPLGMASCGFGAPAGSATGAAPSGHDPAMNPIAEDSNPPVLAPAGGVHCSMADWGRFLSELIRGYHGESDLFEQATAIRLLTPISGSVAGAEGFTPGLGWLAFDSPIGQVFMHDGSNGLWFSQAVLVPDRNMAVVGVSNHEDTGMPAVAAALQALSEMYPGETR